MSALHQAVARAIHEARGDPPVTFEDYTPEGQIVLSRHLASAAVGVVLAEATRSIEPLTPGTGSVLYDEGFNDALGDVLAVLAALGEGEA